MPLEGYQLVIEPNYPGGQELAKIGAADDEPLPDDVTFVNSWWSRRRQREVVIWREGGKTEWAVMPDNRLELALRTGICADAWGIEQEYKAIQLLGTLLPHHAFKRYLLTGMFLETSKRSGVSYLFRRLRPTIALRQGEKRAIALCALCLHPIAYYTQSWAGAMTPTDDVIAHLMLMRADEPMFWRRSNQHPLWRPEAGL